MEPGCDEGCRAGVRRRASPTRRPGCQPRSGSRSSTTTARCGARSRCRSSSTSSCGGWSRWREEDPALRERQPWKAAHERDYAWFGAALASTTPATTPTCPRWPAASSRPSPRSASTTSPRRPRRSCAARATPRSAAATSSAPTRRWCSCSGYLEENGFTSYIVSGGGRDFMRPITAEVYGVPSERVIGSATALAYVPDGDGGTIVRKAAADYLDDGPEKPVRIWNRVGRRPVLAGGNSNGDIEMLDWSPASGRPVAAAAGAARRRRARVRLRVGVGEGARARRRRRLDRGQRQGRLGQRLLTVESREHAVHPSGRTACPLHPTAGVGGRYSRISMPWASRSRSM